MVGGDALVKGFGLSKARYFWVAGDKLFDALFELLGFAGADEVQVFAVGNGPIATPPAKDEENGR